MISPHCPRPTSCYTHPYLLLYCLWWRWIHRLRPVYYMPARACQYHRIALQGLAFLGYSGTLINLSASSPTRYRRKERKRDQWPIHVRTCVLICYLTSLGYSIAAQMQTRMQNFRTSSMVDLCIILSLRYLLILTGANNEKVEGARIKLLFLHNVVIRLTNE
jgi:hypothetical protein